METTTCSSSRALSTCTHERFPPHVHAPPLPALVHFFLVLPSHSSAIVYTRKQCFHHRPPRPARARKRSAPAHYNWGAKSASSPSTSRGRRAWRRASTAENAGNLMRAAGRRRAAACALQYRGAILRFPSRTLLPTNARLSPNACTCPRPLPTARYARCPPSPPGSTSGREIRDLRPRARLPPFSRDGRISWSSSYSPRFRTFFPAALRTREKNAEVALTHVEHEAGPFPPTARNLLLQSTQT
ncbi:hypothetical protein K438DRAFT_1972900 [Mycena galopus ATCC 62051]|nr:hypothetical protein K438DRAFT_1972900 [Mycena galopus ATCC 62051]